MYNDYSMFKFADLNMGSKQIKTYGGGLNVVLVNVFVSLHR